MDVREKLVELLDDIQRCGEDYTDYEIYGMRLPDTVSNEDVASHLIANGVTVQVEAKLYWKPVKPGEWNLTCSACDSHLGCREDANFCPECGAKFVYPKAVAPKPPKGE